MGLRDMLRRSAKAIFDEVVDRVLERRADERPPPRSPRDGRSPASPARAGGGIPAEGAEGPRNTTAIRADDTVRMDVPPLDVLDRASTLASRDDETQPMTLPPRDGETPRRSADETQRIAVPDFGASRDASGPMPGADDTLRMQAPPADLDDESSLDEPILTRTMAGVLAAQGYHERALRIYDHLLRSRPDDDDLGAEADAVRGRLAEGDGPPEDEVAAVPVKQDALLVSWKVTPRSIERARAVLGGEGELTARVVVVARGRGAQLASETLEHPAGAETGEHLFTRIPRRARCTASVGLLRNDRFVSVAHSRVVPT